MQRGVVGSVQYAEEMVDSRVVEAVMGAPAASSSCVCDCSRLETPLRGGAAEAWSACRRSATRREKSRPLRALMPEPWKAPRSSSSNVSPHSDGKSARGSAVEKSRLGPFAAAAISTSRHSRNARAASWRSVSGRLGSCKMNWRRFRSASEVEDPYMCRLSLVESDSDDEPPPPPVDELPPPPPR